MILLRNVSVVLLSVFGASYAMNRPKELYSPSPAMRAHNKHYFAVELPKAAAKETEDEKETTGSDLQHGGQYKSLPYTQDRRFGRGSSGKDSKL